MQHLLFVVAHVIRAASSAGPALAAMAKKLTRGEEKPAAVLAVSVLVTFLW